MPARRSALIRAAGALVCAGVVFLVVAAVVRTFRDAQGPHSAMKSVFTKPPTPLPLYEQLDGPLMGNGDMAVALCGNPEDQQFWLSKNDLWELRPVWCMSGPRPFGHLDIKIPQLSGATYHAEQTLTDATTLATFTKGPTTVTMRSWVCATENLLIVELAASGAPVDGSVDLWIPARARTKPMSDHRPKHGTADDWVGMPAAPVTDDGTGTFRGVRGFDKDVAVPAAAACAFRLQGGTGSHFRLQPGEPVTLVAAMKSPRQSKDYVADASRLVAFLDREKVAALYAAHRDWWREFWDKSSVELGDPELEWRYHVSNYLLGSCSRDADYPPGIAGTWVTTDQPMWTGAYTLNYNHQACFYGLYSSNHIEQADPEDAPILAFMERGQYYAREVLNCRGVLYPVKIGPVGVETTGDPRHPDYVISPKDDPWLRQKGGLFLGQRSDAAFAAVNMARRWYTTYDLDYGRKVYPFVREVARFWEDYLKFEATPEAMIEATKGLPPELRQPPDGRYVSYHDGANEDGQDTNPAVSLAFIRNVLRLATDLSAALQTDEQERIRWQEIVQHLSAFSTAKKDGRTVLLSAEKALPASKGRKPWASITSIYPSGAIGLGSDPRLLAIARNTITVSKRWITPNGCSSIFPAAARVGYNPATILTKLHDLGFQPNGVVVNPMHMLENSSVVPNTVNEMLLQSHEGIIRLFPVWPRHHDARFRTLRADGAFLVSASLGGGSVRDVRILSEKGRECTVQNPWPECRVRLIRDGREADLLGGDTLRFRTNPGESIDLTPTGVLGD